MMRINTLKLGKFSTAALLSMTLVVTLTRCSPISMSKSKYRTSGGTAQTNPAPAANPPASGGAISSTSSPTTLATPQPGSPLVGVQATVLEYNNYLAEIAALPSNQRMTIAYGTPSAEALDSFKHTRALILHFAGTQPDECKAYLGLKMSDMEISNYGWNSQVTPILVDCTLQKDGNWKVEVSGRVSQDTWSAISELLRSVTIHVSNNPRMTLVKPTSAPTVRPVN